MIKEKLKVLLESGVIDQETFDYSITVLAYLLENKIINTAEAADVFLTHLAMADARRKAGEAVNALDDFILNEIKGDLRYEQAVTIWKQLQVLEPKEFVNSELGYFHLHLTNMIEES